MKKVVCFLFLALLLTAGAAHVWAEEELPPKLHKLTDEAYHYVALAHAIYHHAKENNSNVGMYFATFTLGTIREQSGNNELAEKSYLQALELKEKYLPDESAAPCYLGLCEIALRKFDTELSITYAENEVKEQELANDRLMLEAESAIAIIIIVFLAIIVYRRNKHTKHLSSLATSACRLCSARTWAMPARPQKRFIRP